MIAIARPIPSSSGALRVRQRAYVAVLTVLMCTLGGSRRLVVIPDASRESSAAPNAYGEQRLRDPLTRFRLGTAAGPFGFSAATAITDFDADNQPDFAVADRLDRETNDYRYSIQFLLSNGSIQTFVFSSPQDAVNVRLEDIDGDNDVDVVATQALGDEVVDIWVNDGRGRFHEADLHAFPPMLPHRTAVITSAHGLVVSDAVLVPKCGGEVHLAAAGFLTGSDDSRRFTTSFLGIATSFPRSWLALRGPPQPPLLLNI